MVEGFGLDHLELALATLGFQGGWLSQSSSWFPPQSELSFQSFQKSSDASAACPRVDEEDPCPQFP